MISQKFRFAAALMLLTSTLPANAGPAKPGLWETTTHSDGESETDQHCIKAGDNSFAEWRKQIRPDCTIKTLKDTPTAIAYDYSCASATQNGKGHLEVIFSQPTQYRAKFSFDGKLIAGGKNIPLTTKMEQEGRWVSADCSGIDSGDEDEG
jgi:hypothetical protein